MIINSHAKPAANKSVIRGSKRYPGILKRRQRQTILLYAFKA